MRIVITSFGTLVWLFGMAAADGASVNLDFEGGTADTTHVGDDGIYSSPGGTLWTSVLPNVAQSNLKNEFGGVTPLGVAFSSSASGVVDGSATNNLQDSGFQVGGLGTGLQIVGLDPDLTYDIAGYIGPNAGFNVTDATGSLGFIGFGDPTYALPGIETIDGGQRGDYILFSDLEPADLGGGEFGITISTDGVLTGLQIIDIVPEPATAWLLVLGLVVVGGGRRRRR